MVAGAAFAADVSAKVKIDGSLFNYDGSTISMFKVKHQQESWNPILDFKFNGEKAGAEIKFYNYSGTWDSNGYEDTLTSTIHDTEWSVWFKPFDILKISTGKIGTNLNQETIDWSNTKTGCDGYGYAAGVSTNGISFDLMMLPGADKYWFTKAEGADATIAETYFKAGYSADFGTVNAMFDYKKDDMKFGVGYSGAAGAVSYFVNAIGYYKTEFTAVRFEPFVAYSAGALSVKLWNPIDYSLTADSDALDVNTVLKASYGLGSITPFLYVNADNWCSSSKKITVKPGVDGSVGEMSYGVYLNITIPTAENSKVSVDVPVYFTVNF